PIKVNATRDSDNRLWSIIIFPPWYPLPARRGEARDRCAGPGRFHNGVSIFLTALFGFLPVSPIRIMMPYKGGRHAKHHSTPPRNARHARQGLPSLSGPRRNG